MNAKLASGLSARTVQYIHATLRRALGQALKWDLVARNVATLVDPPRVVRPEVQPLTPEAAKALLEAARGDRLSALYTVALALGLRQGELLGLRWADVDLDNGFLHVRRALQRIDGKLQLVEPKTAKSRRTIAMPAFVVAALREHRLRQGLERMFVGEGWQDAFGLVFTTAIGTPLDEGNVRRQFKRLLAKAGLPDMRFHDLRHSCASLLLAQGLSLRAIMEVLGHSQIALTANTYTHILPQMQREAADAMDRFFG